MANCLMKLLVLLSLVLFMAEARLLQNQQEEQQQQQLQQLQSMLVGGSGPSPGGNSLLPTATSKLSVAPPSGPSPGGNSEILGAEKQVSKEQLSISSILVAPSGPNPGGNSVKPTERTLAEFSGPSPRGNTAPLSVGGTLFVDSELGSKLPKDTPMPPSGPSKDHNGISVKIVTLDKNQLRDQLPKNTPTPPSGPNPGGNAVITSSSLKIACSQHVHPSLAMDAFATSTTTSSFAG